MDNSFYETALDYFKFFLFFLENGFLLSRYFSCVFFSKSWKAFYFKKQFFCWELQRLLLQDVLRGN